MEKILIWLDDERPVPKYLLKKQYSEVIICRTYEQAVNQLNYICRTKSRVYISFDHDLGEEKTGYDLAKYIIEHNISIDGFLVHSMNPVGRKNIVDLLVHYGYKNKI